MPAICRHFPALVLVFSLTMIPVVFSDALAQGDLGGDDILLLVNPTANKVSLDIASNGDIYAACSIYHDEGYLTFIVFRSQDHGTTWEEWGGLESEPGIFSIYTHPFLQVVEGNVNKCFVAYIHSSSAHTPRVMMVSSDLADPTADFSSPVIVMNDGVSTYANPRFDTDVASFSWFYIYLVAEISNGAGGDDIIFSRSSNLGASFETPYLVGTLLPTDRNYANPDVSYGFGGYVNVVWDYTKDDGVSDTALRYNYATNSAGAGSSDWAGVHALGSTTDGIDFLNPRIEASASGQDVVVAYQTRQPGKAIGDPGVFVSSDNGMTFPGTGSIPDGVYFLGDIQEQPGSGNWFMCGSKYPNVGIHRANIADLTTWTLLESFNDQDVTTHRVVPPVLALDPDKDFRPAVLWSDHQGIDGDDAVYFDADWRSDPGYPVMEPGFPVTLDAETLSAPSVVDVDGDGDLEIVFGDTNGHIQIFQKDGTPLPGWPVDVGEGLSPSPIAVGDLQGNGEMSVVAGAMSGRIHCYDAQGQVAAGEWPYVPAISGVGFVAIGNFGQGPYPRGIATSIGFRGRLLDHAGGIFPGTPHPLLAREATFAPAIGDIDGDGLAEIVFANEETVVAVHAYSGAALFGHYMPANLSGSVSLGDLDLDGDLEVVVPLENGELHVFDKNGDNFPGFPFVGSTGSALSSAAIAQLLGTFPPEIATAARSYYVHLIYNDGIEHSNYPVSTEGWTNFGSPIIGRIDGSSADVVLGSRGRQAWAWTNLGYLVDGWPKAGDYNFYLAPAMGDIDLDGSSEVVLLSTDQLLVVDIHNTPTDPNRTWPMAGHDAQRTGCADCPEDLVTPVEDDLEIVTRVSFAQPSPNPSSGSATFRFAVPGPAVVNLEVFDVRGHRVSLVTREEVGSGNHVVSWGGLNDRGAPLASGLYFARLRVRGPGINEEVTRKITLAR